MTTRSQDQTEALRALGTGKLPQPSGGPSVALLEAFPNCYPQRPYVISISFPEFTSLCPVTGQPDLAAMTIHYEGRAISPQGLLKYLISYRCHKGFHEQCVEQIYHDLKEAFNPQALEVYACFTRRGGIDINPFRSSRRDVPEKIIREKRQ